MNVTEKEAGSFSAAQLTALERPRLFKAFMMAMVFCF